VKRLSAEPFYYTLEFVLSLPSWVVVAVFLVRDLDLSPLQLILVGTVMEAAVFVFEVPTGAFADSYGRRLSIAVSCGFQGAAYVLVGLATNFVTVLVAWALWGFGWTFMSGAYQAWITDEVGADRVGRVFARGSQLGYVGALIGLVGSVGLATLNLRLPIVLVGVVIVALGVATVLFMPETGFRRATAAERADPFAELRGAVASGVRYVRIQPLLLAIVAIDFFAGMSTEAMDRLREAHFIRDIGLPRVGSLDPVVWFGLFGVGSLAIGFVASQYLVRRFEREQPPSLARWLAVLTTAQGAALAFFALSGRLGLALAAFWLYGLTRALDSPLYMTWLNQNIGDSSVRATVISIAGQSNAIGQAGGGPLLGAVGNLFGIRAALLAGAVVIAPAVGLYARALRHGGREPELEQLPQPSEAV
jgi:DHA3 family tetracycline resistance protein-like MFS transporter